MRAGAVLWGIVIGIGAAVCSADSLTVESRLAIAEEAWSRVSAENYEYTFTYNAMWYYADCRERKIRIRVKANAAARIDPCNDSASIRDLHSTVPALFKYIHVALSKKPDKIDVTFDPTMGFPLTLNVDFKSNTTDDEFCFEVSEFAVVN